MVIHGGAGFGKWGHLGDKKEVLGDDPEAVN
jgi:hypothetical protein